MTLDTYMHRAVAITFVNGLLTTAIEIVLPLHQDKQCYTHCGGGEFGGSHTLCGVVGQILIEELL